MRVAAILLCFLCLFAATSRAQPAWQSNLDSKIRFYETTDFGIVLAGSEKSLYAIDGETGERIWRRATGKIEETAVTPVPNTDLILFSHDLGSKSRLEAVDVLSGSTIWQSEKVKGDVMQLAIDPENDLIAVILVKDTRGKSGDNFKQKPVVHVLQLSTGEELWHRDFDDKIEMMPARFGEDLGEIDYTLDNYRAPLLLDGRLYLFYEGSTSYDARTGKEKENEKFKINVDGLALTEADPVFDDTHLYVSGKGRVRAINRRTGHDDWKADDLGTCAEMALIGSTLYVRTGGQFTQLKDGETKEKGPFGVSAINTANGKTLWRWKGADKGLTNFVFGDRETIFVSDKDELFAINSRSGNAEYKIKHGIKEPKFLILNEKREAIVGGKDEIAAFDAPLFDIPRHGDDGKLVEPATRFPNQITASFAARSFSSMDKDHAIWRVHHNAPARGVFRVAAGIALRTAAIYFRYGGLATSAIGLARTGLSLATAANSFRWSGLATRFDSVDLTTLASNSARNYTLRRIYAYGSLARTPSLVTGFGGFQVTIPNATDIRGKIIGRAIDRAIPSRADVQDSIFDRLDPVRHVEKLSSYLLRRKSVAELRSSRMYFYTDLQKPFDKKGLVGVNVHNGNDDRVVLASDPDPRFVIDETVGLLYSANGDRLQAFDILNR